MKLSASDLPLLGKQLALLVFAILFSLTLSIIGRDYLGKMQEKAHAAEKSLIRIEDRIRQARQGDSQVPQAAYARMTDRGAFREFKRIDLVEELEKAEPMLFDLQYSLFPARKISPSGHAELNLNRAHFQLGLLHEGKLLDFFDFLKEQKNGIPLFPGCGIERLSVRPALEPNLKAECTVIWMTMEEGK
jgi:hypothetical protein